jgi:hypothetical protein
MVLKGTGCEDVDWIKLAYDRGQCWGFYQHGNEHSGFIKGREILEQLSDCYLIENDSCPWSYILLDILEIYTREKFSLLY